MSNTLSGFEKMLMPRWYWLFAALGFGAFGVLCVVVGAITLAGSDVFITNRWLGLCPLAFGTLLLWKAVHAVATLRRA